MWGMILGGRGYPAQPTELESDQQNVLSQLITTKPKKHFSIFFLLRWTCTSWRSWRASPPRVQSPKRHTSPTTSPLSSWRSALTEKTGWSTATAKTTRYEDVGTARLRMCEIKQSVVLCFPVLVLEKCEVMSRYVRARKDTCICSFCEGLVEMLALLA